MARSSSRTAKTYASKVDLWIVAVIGASLIAAIAGVGVAGLQEGAMRFAQGFFILLGVFGFLVWTFLTTNYTLDGRHLIARSGPFTWRIAFDDISSIEKPAGNFLARSSSGPALSMDRLVVHYGGGKRLMISPAEQDKFLADFRARQKSPG
jgi:hypothetical protein